jgi:diketogulonate reductase-like aldo/keto reductase
MRQRALGWTGVAIPVVGQGTWNMEHDDRQAAVAALRRGLDLGLSHVDTAELYGSGRVEELVAEALGTAHGSSRRDEVFLASKVVPSNASRAGTQKACERSLRRLRTDRLDLYMLHWPGSHPLAETIAALEALRTAGKVRFWGVSNFDVPELEAALAIAGEGTIACNQVLYHLEERSIEHRVLPFCAQHRIAVVGYSPFGSGAFPAPRSPGGRTLAQLAARHEVSPRAVALSFLTRDDALFTIPKASSAEHVEQNARGDVALSAEEVAALDAAFPRGNRAGLPSL